MKKLFKCLLVAALFIGSAISNNLYEVKAEEALVGEYGEVIIDFTNAKVGDVYRVYENEETGDFVEVEIVDYKPNSNSISPRIEYGNWSGSMPEGTWTLVPRRSYGIYYAEFCLDVKVGYYTSEILAVYSPAVFVPGGAVTSPTLDIIRSQTASGLNAMAEMKWTQNMTITGVSAAGMSAYLRCDIMHQYARYRIAYVM